MARRSSSRLSQGSAGLLPVNGGRAGKRSGVSAIQHSTSAGRAPRKGQPVGQGTTSTPMPMGTLASVRANLAYLR